MKAKKADILVDQLGYLLFALFKVDFNGELEVEIHLSDWFKFFKVFLIYYLRSSIFRPYFKI